MSKKNVCHCFNKCPKPSPTKKELTEKQRQKRMCKAIRRRRKIQLKLHKKSKKCPSHKKAFCTQQGMPSFFDGSFRCFDAFDKASTCRNCEK